MAGGTTRSFLVGAVAVFCSCGGIWGATFRVGPAVVEQDEEFEKVANSLSPGDELILSGGVYSQSGRRAVTAKGTPDAPIVIRADGGTNCVLTRPADNIDRHNNIEFVDCAHLIIRGIHFKGGSCGVRFIRGHHVRFENCQISRTGNNALTMNSGHCDCFIIRRNHIHHTGLSTRGPTEGEGMYIGAHDGRYITTNTLVEGNYIHHLRGTSGGGNDGIEIKYGSYGNTIRDNVIHDTNIGRQYPGIFVYGGGKGVNIVEGNVIWRAGEGIQVVSDAVVRNNVILDCSVTGITAAPHGAVPKMQNVKIVHNTIVNHPRGIRIRWSKAQDMVFANNAVYCPDGMAIDAAGIEAATIISNCVAGRLGGVRIDGRSLIDGGSPAAAFRNVGERDFRLGAGSPLIGRANKAYATAQDFDGNKRTAPFAVGAYEFTDNIQNHWALREGFKVTPARRTSGIETVVKDSQQLQAALKAAKPGDVILLAPGIYRGGVYIQDVSGTKGLPIVIKGRDASNRPVFSGGGGEGLRLSDCNHVALANLVAKRWGRSRIAGYAQLASIPAGEGELVF